MKETYRDRRASHTIETVAQDVRYAFRMMRKSPGFTTVAVVSLAVGIGANTAVFSAADAHLLRPLTVPRPGEALTVGSTSPVARSGSPAASYRDYVDVRDRSKSFEGLLAFTNSVVGFASDADTLPRLRIGMLVSANFFPVLGVQPELGRAFRGEEDQVPGRDAVLILGHDFWEQQFVADRSIVGRTVRLNGIAFTVLGVAPPSSRVWINILASAGASRALATVWPGGPAGDSRTDVVAFPLVGAIVLAVTLLAAYIPARRASRINPTEALRNE